VAATTLTLAGLVWLQQSTALAATGRRIAEHEHAYQALLERRSLALQAHAAASDPVVLAARAQALGFAEPVAVDYLVVDGPLEHGALLALGSDSPLAGILTREPAAVDAPPSGLGALVAGLFEPRPAQAEERPVAAVGGYEYGAGR
jgi:hypothetical protein